ncbi:5' exonuclease Apollo isoform X1 [Pistacia vera]|uniref:5' exonuclease Apollo isoform X1 n=1 Tax=Pistacia vera TaxID=55513 RepID=UPI001262F099|nr:5' exonuclease Apollo isoform X1 [Pistacia vera]
MEKGLISVYQWTQGSQAYFLTHLHSDHTKGLTSSWTRGPLFCSRLTAKLFPLKFPGLNLSLLRVLDIGSWHSISLMSPSSGEKTVVQVMAIDAHHCPGSIMLLFRGEFGCLLYTGDFRWETDGERAKTARNTLLKALKEDAVDIIYLDNTYCNPSYDFPSREVAAQQVADIIASHPNHDIIIGIDTLGKEELLVHISRLLNIKIWVWPERLQTMHLLGFHDIFTTKTSLTRVRAVPRYSFSIDTLERLNTMRPTIGIMPSGLPWLVKPFKGKDKLFGSLLTPYNRSQKGANGGMQTDKRNDNLGSADRFHKYIYSVPYSDHSCFMEIQEFVKLVQPVKVRGIVSSSSCYVDPLYYFGRLCGANQPSRGLHNSEESKSLSKRVIAVQTNCYARSGNSTEAGRKRGRTPKVDFLGVNVSKANTLRRIRRGAKIAQSE